MILLHTLLSNLIEGNKLVDEIKNEHLKTLAELACPIATKFSQDMKNLYREMKNHGLKKTYKYVNVDFNLKYRYNNIDVLIRK